MDTLRICKQCLKPVPKTAPEDLCPECLATVAPGNELAVADADPASLGWVRYFGDYELHEEIARGGMGVVYKARQVSLNRIVAVKMILAGQLASEAEVKRFRTEAEVAAHLQHPNIVAIHEVGEHHGQQYFSMDFVVGTSLAARLGKEPLTIGEAVRWMKTIAEAVHFAHQRGIVHRDLKPANVLLNEFGQPRITDFGLAKRLERTEPTTASGAILGTPDYMSPEQAAGRQDIVGPAGDIFSLGAMLYEMITGRTPFRGSNLSEILSNILQKDPEPPSRLNPRVPPDLETICLKCLEKRPDRRYATADALAKDLGHFLDHEAISARPVEASRRFTDWLMRHPQILAALASGVLLALVWLGYGLWTETRILTWEKEHPSVLKPASGWSGFEPSSLMMLTIFLLVLMGGLENQFAKRTRARVMTGRFVSPRVLDAFGLAGLAGAVLSMYLGTAEIESWRWANHALALGRGQLTAELATEANDKELQKQFVEHKELQNLRVDGQAVLGPAFILDLEVKRFQKQAAPMALTGLLLLAAASMWRGATLTCKAFREHRFVFYPSAEEERIARSQALLE